MQRERPEREKIERKESESNLNFHTSEIFSEKTFLCARFFSFAFLLLHELFRFFLRSLPHELFFFLQG